MVIVLVLLLVRLSEYSFIRHEISTDIYLGIVAFAFVGLGFFLGAKIWRGRIQETAVTFNTSTAEELGLSKRECEVLEQIALGLSNQDIAEKLFISLSTVKSHAANLYFKLDVQRRTQAVSKARELGLIQS